MTAVTTGKGAADEVDSLADAMFADQLAARPLYAAQLGYRDYLGRLPDLSEEAADRRRSALVDLGRRAEAVPDAELDEERRITRRMLVRRAGDEVAAIDAAAETYTVSPLPHTGPVASLVVGLPKAILQTSEDAEAYLEACHRVPAYVDEAIGALGRGREQGRTPVRRLVRNTAAQIDQYLALPLADDPFAHPMAPDDVARDWPDRLAEAVRTDIRPALTRYRGALDAVTADARGDDRVGVVDVPGGAALYEQLIAQHTTTDLSVREIHDLGQTLVAELTEEMSELGESVLGTRDFEEIKSRLRHDPELFFRTEEEVAAAAADAKSRAEAALPQWLGTRPETPCVVLPMPPLETENGDLGHYQWPGRGGSRPGTYWINTSNPTTRPRFESQVLAFHESVPGHHTQLALASELADQCAFRRHASVTAFQEGWALYVERLADEMGLYTSGVDRLGTVSFDFWRACRLVVDTGMHAYGWSRDRAVAYMFDHSALTRKNVENEIDRYIGWPGQALGYMLGRIEIRRQRARAEEALGARFDRRAFHDAIVGHGSVPLSVLDEVTGRWVDSHTVDPHTVDPHTGAS